MLDSKSLILLFMILSVLFILMIVLVYSMNKKFLITLNNNYDKYKDKIREENDDAIKDIYSKLRTEFDNKSNLYDTKSNTEKDLFNIFLKLRESIKENCMITMNSIKASRLAIYLLHNGTYSTHGISFFKMSCICEKIAIGSGVRERMIEHTNIPINLFDEMIDKIITNNRYIVMNDENLSNSNHKIFISSDKICYSQLIAIYDMNNNVLGFILAEMDHPYSKDMADKEKEIIDDLVKQLVPVLSYSDYTKNNTI